MVLIVALQGVGHVVIDHWRTQGIEEWRKGVNEFIDDIREAKGKADQIHDDLERRIERLERGEDSRRAPR